jgi:hypothetical protein
MVLYEIYREDGGNGITFVHMMYIVTYSGMLVLEGKIQLWYKALICKTLWLNKNKIRTLKFHIIQYKGMSSIDLISKPCVLAQ